MKAVLDSFGTPLFFDHELKTWSDVYWDIIEGRKVHEYRKNDRGFKVSDLVLLREFIPTGERYTGEEVAVRITSISYGPEWGIPEGYAVFSIRIMRGAVVDLEDGK